MKISVIIPVFNVENYLPKMIDSILSQQEKNFEIILIDDGSTDASGEVCDNYARIYNNIRTVHQRNKGASSARNEGIKLAKGEYLFFLDADDEVRKNYFSYMMDAFETNESDMVCCSYSTQYKKEKAELCKQQYTSESPRNMMYELIQGLTGKKTKKKYNGYLWCKAFKRKIICNNGLTFDKNIIIWEDTLFIENYLCYCDQITFLNNNLYFYRNRKESITRSTATNQMFQSMVLVFKKIIRLNKAPLKVRLRAFFRYIRILLTNPKLIRL